MKKSRFQTPWERDESVRKEKPSKKPSMTVQGQAYTPSEIIDRFTQGLPLDGSKTPQYHGEDAHIDLRKMELTDLMELRVRTQENITSIKEEINLKEMERRKKLQEEFDEYRREKEKAAAAKQNEEKEVSNDKK